MRAIFMRDNVCCVRVLLVCLLCVSVAIFYFSNGFWRNSFCGVTKKLRHELGYVLLALCGENEVDLRIG